MIASLMGSVSESYEAGKISVGDCSLGSMVLKDGFWLEWLGF
jgi:hypothetical protein